MFIVTLYENLKLQSAVGILKSLNCTDVCCTSHKIRKFVSESDDTVHFTDYLIVEVVWLKLFPYEHFIKAAQVTVLHFVQVFSMAKHMHIN